METNGAHNFENIVKGMGGKNFRGQHNFMKNYACESQTVSFCQDIADSLDEGSWIDGLWLTSYSLMALGWKRGFQSGYWDP